MPTTRGETKNRRPMADEHKAALAEGRDQGRAIRRYLEALETHRPRRGRQRTVESIQQRLADIEQSLAQSSNNALQRVQLIQEKLDLESYLEVKADDGVDLEALEQEFVAVVRPYSERKGISYDAWRSIGVSPAVLREAGLTRSA